MLEFKTIWNKEKAIRVYNYIKILPDAVKGGCGRDFSDLKFAYIINKMDRNLNIIVLITKEGYI